MLKKLENGESDARLIKLICVILAMKKMEEIR